MLRGSRFGADLLGLVKAIQCLIGAGEICIRNKAVRLQAKSFASRLRRLLILADDLIASGQSVVGLNVPRVEPSPHLIRFDGFVRVPDYRILIPNGEKKFFTFAE